MMEFILLFAVLQWSLFIGSSSSSHSSHSSSSVEFYVVRGGNPVRYERVEESLSSTLGFDRERSSTPRPAVFLLHGLGSSYRSDCNERISQALLERRDMNVIVVDYQHSVRGPSYDRAARNVDNIGRRIGDFLVSSQKDECIDLSSTTLIGFSLGAHVAGVAGHHIKEHHRIHSGFLQKIIGLDPARPVFVNFPSARRLDRNDADYVIVIHTAGGFLGIEEPMGHADFYPNGGRDIQPWCSDNHGKSALICSHRAACAYLVESIDRPIYEAVRCSSWEDFNRGSCHDNPKVSMGFDTDGLTQGKFFLRTGRDPPHRWNWRQTTTTTTYSESTRNERSALSYNVENISGHHFHRGGRSCSSMTSEATSRMVVLVGFAQLVGCLAKFSIFG